MLSAKAGNLPDWDSVLKDILPRTSYVNVGQDTIREPNGQGDEGGGGGGVIAVPPPMGWATTTAQTEDPAKRAPPSPPTESAIDMRGGGRRRDVQKEKNLQSARCDQTF